MNEKEINELEQIDQWDDESIEVHKPKRNTRAVVSVSFNGPEFAKVSTAAELVGVKTSSFIKNAALLEASSLGGSASFCLILGTLGNYNRTIMADVSPCSTWGTVALFNSEFEGAIDSRGKTASALGWRPK